MKVLLDTNIIIHREGNSLLHDDIGKLYFWLDKLHCEKFVHFSTIKEITKYKDSNTVDSFKRKLQSYNAIAIASKLDKRLETFKNSDKTENDLIDTQLLNEILLNHVDLLITEDRGIKKKAKLLELGSKVLNIYEFLEWILAENPELTDYTVKTIRLEKFGNIPLNQPFFDTFKKDYNNFDKWYAGKFNQEAYVCGDNNDIYAFLFLKTEETNENYNDIFPQFTTKKRLKIGTFKVVVNGYRIGERFIKIICDNAIKRKVEEIYVTIFEDEPPQKQLVALLKKFGFIYWGTKGASERKENVYVKIMDETFLPDSILNCYPYIPNNRNAYFVAIENRYHTKLFPDSILHNENPNNFSMQEAYSNAIRKCYISNSYSTAPQSGDILVFYRNGGTGGMYKGVFTTIGIFESIKSFGNFNSFYEYASNRTVLTKKEMVEWWNKNSYYKPKIIDFLYIYSFPKRLNLKEMIDLGFDRDIMGKGIQQIKRDVFIKLIKQSNMDLKYFAK